MATETSSAPETLAQIHNRVAAQRDDILKFMREICAIPSMNSLIGPVGERVGAEMRRLGFDEVRFDKMGNILGRIGRRNPDREARRWDRSCGTGSRHHGHHND